MSTALAVDGEIRLMKAIIIQALDDATASLPSSEHPAQKPGEDDKRYAQRCRGRAEHCAEVERNQRKARRWLTGNSRRFRLICTWAELDPEYVARKVKELAASGWPRRFDKKELRDAA